jgi:hypothetical protein
VRSDAIYPIDRIAKITPIKKALIRGLFNNVFVFLLSFGEAGRGGI